MTEGLQFRLDKSCLDFSLRKRLCPLGPTVVIRDAFTIRQTAKPSPGGMPNRQHTSDERLCNAKLKTEIGAEIVSKYWVRVLATPGESGVLLAFEDDVQKQGTATWANLDYKSRNILILDLSRSVLSGHVYLSHRRDPST
ncbi:unnamed protein product [Protopolystoma xenopodis]|uniref:Uncharacterized protein n=1 Tax=Protopolystoma xenopodis TaxID=117903 RepID=A0A3S5ABJ2_9PLAT|nr:unnamed protein product [Protopolystoma xenopodis]